MHAAAATRGGNHSTNRIEDTGGAQETERSSKPNEGPSPNLTIFPARRIRVLVRPLYILVLSINMFLLYIMPELAGAHPHSVTSKLNATSGEAQMWRSLAVIHPSAVVHFSLSGRGSENVKIPTSKWVGFSNPASPSHSYDTVHPDPDNCTASSTPQLASHPQSQIATRSSFTYKSAPNPKRPLHCFSFSSFLPLLFQITFALADLSDDHGPDRPTTGARTSHNAFASMRQVRASPLLTWIYLGTAIGTSQWRTDLKIDAVTHLEFKWTSTYAGVMSLHTQSMLAAIERHWD
ncbi:uncharacterized protein N7482_006280 [Penicillium canariense]|uniref:Uncharacterized protein n=1 Tax=Penicillium canariense TaxID=189055 RepID=A0A9W9LN28_9EURO|nr:uncharacterized protein N7482_006280 [Penicillium canariense]KAJ5167499.1 hypothetical protein N7482_006280 [Penicillium canariense]